MKCSFLILLCLFCSKKTLFGQEFPLFHDMLCGAAEGALHRGQWSVFANPACGKAENMTLGIAGARLMGVQNLYQSAIAGTLFKKTALIGFGFSHLQLSSAYSVQRALISANRALDQRFQLGLSVGVRRQWQADEGGRWYPEAILGCVFQMNENQFLSFAIHDPFPYRKGAFLDERQGIKMLAALESRLSDRLSAQIGFAMRAAYGAGISSALQYKMKGMLTLQTAVASAPWRFIQGVGFQYSKINFQFGFSYGQFPVSPHLIELNYAAN